MTAAEALTRALVALADRGRRPRCDEPGGHEMWCSDDADERALAARWCTGCPVLVECGATADEQGEKFGVFGGTDRTLPPAKRKSATVGNGTEEDEDRRGRRRRQRRRTTGRGGTIPTTGMSDSLSRKLLIRPLKFPPKGDP